jgi:iron complex outermembrane receptor protein
MKIVHRFAISLCIAVLSLANLAHGATDSAQPLPTGSDATSGASEDGSISEIVVTATRREERLRDVPSAITVVSGDKIAELGITSIEDYQAFVPGLATRDNGVNGFGAVILRGMNTGPEQNTATVAFYMDEAPTTGSSFSGAAAFINPDVELADVARIEVLKGPQGTLYGANSLGGIIRVISATPDATRFSSDVRSEVSSIDGGSTGYFVKGALNVPLITDVLALRVSASYRDVPGFTDNVGTGTKNVNTGDDVGFRAALRATPTPDLTISLSTLYQDLRKL